MKVACAWCGRSIERPRSKVGIVNYCTTTCTGAARRGRRRPDAKAQSLFVEHTEPLPLHTVSVEAAARGFVQARRAMAGADSAGMMQYQMEADLWYHELCLALGEPCACDDDTCPGQFADPRDVVVSSAVI